MDIIIKNLEEEIKKIIGHLQKSFGELRSSAASPTMVENIVVADEYGTESPLKYISAISAGGLEITIRPHSGGSKICNLIVDEVSKAKIGTPGTDGQVVRIKLLPMTEETRKKTLAQAKALYEEARVSVRNCRHESRKEMDKLALPDSEKKNAEKKIDDKIKEGNDKLDAMMKEREGIIMKV